jgi:response regulator RpfG family c-di-GMP phosphodiesterase
MGCAQEKILIVDDDPNLLSGLCRQFRKRYEMACAENADAALARLSDGECFAVVVSDMRMPGMDGVRFLAELARRHPETVRIMLTGNADQTTAIDAVNRGEVFRFLSKPCPPDDLAAALDAALERHRLQALERDLLERTLAGSVKVLLDVMRTVNPLAFTRALTIRDLAVETARAMGERALWEVNIATLLSGLGWMSVPEKVLQRVAQGLPLTSYDSALVARHPEIAFEMLSEVPRLEGVARIVRFQHRNFDGAGPPIGIPAEGEGIPLGSRILRVLNAVVSLDRPRLPGETALANLPLDEGIYDPAVILTVRDQVREAGKRHSRSGIETLALRVAELRSGDILNADAVSLEGDLLYPAGQVLTELHIARLLHHPDRGTVAEPLSVLRRIS